MLVSAAEPAKHTVHQVPFVYLLLDMADLKRYQVVPGNL